MCYKLYSVNNIVHEPEKTNKEKADKIFSVFKRLYNEDTGETIIEAVVKKSDMAIGLYDYRTNEFFYLDLDTMKGSVKKPKNYYKLERGAR